MNAAAAPARKVHRLCPAAPGFATPEVGRSRRSVRLVTSGGVCCHACHVSRGLTSLAPQPHHKPSMGAISPDQKHLTASLRNEEVTTQIPSAPQSPTLPAAVACVASTSLRTSSQIGAQSRFFMVLITSDGAMLRRYRSVVANDA